MAVPSWACRLPGTGRNPAYLLLRSYRFQNTRSLSGCPLVHGGPGRSYRVPFSMLRSVPVSAKNPPVFAKKFQHIFRYVCAGIEIPAAHQVVLSLMVALVAGTGYRSACYGTVRTGSSLKSCERPGSCEKNSSIFSVTFVPVSKYQQHIRLSFPGWWPL
jgi:hypothetical protein